MQANMANSSNYRCFTLQGMVLTLYIAVWCQLYHDNKCSVIQLKFIYEKVYLFHADGRSCNGNLLLT